MGRWAYGFEITCAGRHASDGVGGCMNLATWLLINDRWPGRNWLTCDPHLASAISLIIKYQQAYKPLVLPFQDPWARPRRKRKAARTPIGEPVRT